MARTAACYVGWFDFQKRGFPPANVLGVLVDGTTSATRAFKAAPPRDPKLAHVAARRARRSRPTVPRTPGRSLTIRVPKAAPAV